MAAGEERRKNALILSPVRRVQRALNGVVWLRAAVAPAWVAATLVVLVRIFLRGQLWVAAAPATVALLVWVYRARRLRVPLAHAAIIADRRGALGGLLLTRLEVPVGAWELEVNERVRALRPPPRQWGRGALALAGAALFLLAAFLVPLPSPAVLHVNAAAASKVAEVEAKAEALAQEGRLDQATEAELARLREELADHRFDAADWEAADGVESALDEQAAQAAADLSRAVEAAKALEEALSAAQAGEGAAREREELERALQSLGETGEALNEALSQAGAGEHPGDPARKAQGKESGATRPTPDQVSSLRKALENRQQRLASAYGQQQQQQRSRQEGRAQGRGKQAGSSKPGEGRGEAEGTGEGGQPGAGSAHASRQAKGAAGRGGGEGELVFGGEANIDPERLKFAPLPPGHGGEAEELWGLRAADPKVSERSAPRGVSGAAAAGDQAPGFKAGPLLPRNRELLKRYFDSPR